MVHSTWDLLSTEALINMETIHQLRNKGLNLTNWMSPSRHALMRLKTRLKASSIHFTISLMKSSLQKLVNLKFRFQTKKQTKVQPKKYFLLSDLRAHPRTSSSKKLFLQISRSLCHQIQTNKACSLLSTFTTTVHYLVRVYSKSRQQTIWKIQKQVFFQHQTTLSQRLNSSQLSISRQKL